MGAGSPARRYTRSDYLNGRRPAVRFLRLRLQVADRARHRSLLSAVQAAVNLSNAHKTKFPLSLPQVCAQLRNTGQWSGELHHISKDGRGVIVDSRMQLLDDTVLEVNRDITDRKQIENALGETEQRLRWLASIIELSDDAIVSKNLDGIVTSWNRGAERIFGHTAAEAIGQPITIVIPEDRQDEERDILTRIRRGERIDHFETIRQRKDGRPYGAAEILSAVRSG